MDPIKELLDTRSPVIALDVGLANWAQSYHLEALVPKHNFFGLAFLRDGPAGADYDRQAAGKYSVETWYFRASRPGRRFIHFYSRKLENLPGSPTLLLKVQELPWITFRVALPFSALTTACLALAAGLVKLNGEDAPQYIAALAGAPLSLALAYLSVFPSRDRLARAAVSLLVGIASLALLASTALVGAALQNGFISRDLTHLLLEMAFYGSAIVTASAISSATVRLIAWRQMYLSRES